MDDNNPLFDYAVLEAVEQETGYETNRTVLPWHPDESGEIIADYGRITDYFSDMDDTPAVFESVDQLAGAGFLEKEPVTRAYNDVEELPDQHAVQLSVTDRGYGALSAREDK